MKTVEAITRASTAKLPLLETPTELIDGLENIVGRGITDYFNEIVWTTYHGQIEGGEALHEETLRDQVFREDLLPQFDDLLLDVIKESPTAKPTQRPNVIPVMAGLATVMLTSQPDSGILHKESFLLDRNFAVMPAHADFKVSCEVEIDLSHGIVFDGYSIVGALLKEGVESQLIAPQNSTPFLAYREYSIGNFLTKHSLEVAQI